ncbi:helix-turn-helix transcriptional regulator [Streptomyces pactum]|uniref:Helix-turn-helix transcriptional regulator n=2 Tax=Streptomyces pactum TaxID=68249 RepID=A0ABS0NMR5_9ACTN|nr:helix-turn-helix transcriptional regulator [Streptomyces pactum]MBH5336468.1 helix-turn-helix transcriptional regulator [Streptomyces pactum]
MAWRYCGNQIKLWRTRANVTRQQLAKEANYGYDSVRSMEQGRRKPTLRLLEIADEMCGAHGLLLAAQDYLKPEKFREYAREFIEYEAEALTLNWYEPLLIPGLLQTEEYARALIGGNCPPLDDETVEVRVAARLERQAVLDKPTRAFGFVIGEAALREQVGGREVHRRQMRRLIEVGERRHVCVQVMRFCRSFHPGLLGSFVLLETPDHEQLAYIEGQETGMLLDDRAKVSVIRQRHDMILQRALGPEESACFIGELAEEL